MFPKTNDLVRNKRLAGRNGHFTFNKTGDSVCVWGGVLVCQHSLIKKIQWACSGNQTILEAEFNRLQGDPGFNKE
jgi:hypothetical protein